MKVFRFGNLVRAGALGLLACLGFGLQAQCPEITVREKYEHLGNHRPLLWRLNNWDTVVNCSVQRITLHADPFITTQNFNGTYLVESIPYNPVDSTFHAGQALAISSDDVWENSAISFPFDFVFFGYTYDRAVVGSNGIVSFNTGGVKVGTTTPATGSLASKIGQYCAYSYNVPIPSSSFPELNAIYGVYEDIDPRGLSTGQGMFRSIGGTYPCRYLCASVNQVPLYPYSSNSNNRCTYQIVCYEGTNIIEVHVKRRSCCSSTNSGKGLIGIQNHTGATQESYYHQPGHGGTPPFYIQPNSPGAFVAPDRGNQSGGWTGTAQYEAWRFTPQGETAKNITWWRLIEDANGNIIDSVEFTNNVGDTNGYYIDIDQHTEVSVAPTRTTRYLVKCRYKGANGYWYGMDGQSMRDTITVGVDTSKQMSLVNGLTNQSGPITICEGRTASINLQYPTEDQTIDSATWSAVKVLYGNRTVMPPSAIQDNFMNCVLRSQDNMLEPNHIDSVWIYCTAKFKNGCTNHDSILVRTFPNFNIHDTAGICNGDSYTWCGETYNTQGVYNKHYYSEPGCDSNRYLHLIVSDISRTTDYVLDCKPHTWINGKVYSADNDDTRWMDTVLLKNQWGCDSTVTLDFTYIPMEAIIHHTPEVATLDELTIECTDASYGHDSRLWLLPSGETTTSSVTYINFPLKGIDSITVRLAVHNNYGCDDTATVVVPLHKVSRYVPNAFTPDRAENNRFQPLLQGNITELQCWIYNRHGELVYYFAGPDGYWDGVASNGTRCPQGTYVYVLRYRTSLEPETTLEVPGTLTLIR